MTHKKDLRLILILVSAELILLTVLSVIAINKYGKRTQNNDGTVISQPTSGTDLPDSTFSPVPATDSVPTAEPTPAPEKYNYYTFNFTENGYTSTKQTATEAEFSGAGSTVTGVTEKKLTIPASKSEFMLGKLYIENHYVGKPLPLTEIFAEPLKLKQLKKDGTNQFIVYYTHTYEAYCLTEEEQLKEKRWYTSTDNEANVVAPGTAFWSKLNSFGFSGVNNTTVHNDGSDALKSYDLSIVTLRKEFDDNPDARFVLDLHRNGYGQMKDGKLYGPTVEADGVKYAKISFVIGLDYSSETGTYEYKTNPYWKDNFKFIFLLIEKLEERVPKITSGIALRRTPYNQEIVPNSILAEIGFEGNLTSEAKNTAELLAEIIAEIYS